MRDSLVPGGKGAPEGKPEAGAAEAAKEGRNRPHQIPRALILGKNLQFINLYRVLFRDA
jgi:hypothetical protein